MTLLPSHNSFGYTTGNVLTTRPATAMGTTITPGNNTYGSYTEILSGANITKDCFGILININSMSSPGAAKDGICTIGIDTSGGTSYATFIPDLLCSCAHNYATAPLGHWYYFPIFIPAGSALAAQASVNNATVGTSNVAVWLYGAPTRPENLIYGYGVESIGINAASSSGTSVTAGEASEGSWTLLGTTTRRSVSWQYGMGCNDSTMGGKIYHADLSYGDGTNQIIIGEDKAYTATASEQLGCNTMAGTHLNVPAGGSIYGRLQCSATQDSALSMAAYNVY